jgi:hypothetical protein
MVYIALFIAWAPILVWLHEAGHAFAALVLTDGEVKIKLHAGGLLGGTTTFDESTLRSARDAAWIAAAGPAVTLIAAGALWLAWLGTNAYTFVTVAGVGAWLASGQFAMAALPIRYSAGMGTPTDSDGRAIWRILTGAPPGGLDRELARAGRPEPPMRRGFAVVLAVVAGLILFVDARMVLELAALFGIAAVLQRIWGTRAS